MFDENYLEASAYFAMDEYFNRTHDVKCLMCGKQITATQDDLDRLGWSINRKGLFRADRCPKGCEI